ncbi:neurogenic locus notch homolog protein 3-like isoform X2 [Eriocheir sinensis]|uniref:neurogenic locus notch homolog protein 3-like isoform X2 n=1 Tax=Eriocheir sinensis TaxID=95602 RepID=UPI0021C8473E|nr:neurogenic locus notch homolog protein 3-like isoform X2 [Eriocheir sinensis]
MTSHARLSKMAAATATVAVVVVACCVAAASAQESTDAAEVTTPIDSLTPDETNSLAGKVTTLEVDEPPDDVSTAKPTTTTTTTSSSTTTTTITTTKDTVNGENTTTQMNANTSDEDVASANTTDSTTPSAPPGNATATTEAACGVNAELIGEECVCRPPWIRDPAKPASPCTCSDLCREQGNVTCPAEGTCRQVSCNLATCICPDPLVYRYSTASCINPCELYGDAVCGLGSGWRCLEEDEGGMFTCQCAVGYTLQGGECQDIDECVGGNDASPCGPNERCVNSDGSHKCVCLDGFLRTDNGSCINMDECLNPHLHSCDHVCRDAQPPLLYTCDCFPGHTWNDTQRRCVLDDPKTACECGPPDRSVCYRAPEGDEQCFPRPGYIKNGTAFLDASECGKPSSERAWCWARGECVEGVGSSLCVCAEGFTSSPPHAAECARVSCPTGTLLAGSTCVDPCTAMLCPSPLTCRTHGATEPSCMCLSRCLNLLQPDSNFSVYHGVFIAYGLSSDNDTSRRVVIALEDYFGLDNAEVVSVTRADFSHNLTESQPINISVEFALVFSLANLTNELTEVIKSQCRVVESHSGLCVLPGGLHLVRDSIKLIDKDPCSDSPCPSEHNLACRVKTNVTGRFVCDCAPGFQKVDVPDSLGYCQDVDECAGEAQPCHDHQDCINTPGGFTCRSKLSLLGQSPEAIQKMAIAFGVLFFVALLALIAVLCLLKKKHKATRELVPMTTGFENASYK